MTNALGVVSAGHELTVRAGEEILRAGGNAYDAVLAALATSCVTEPVLSSLCGGGFLLARPADSRSTVYDFFVQTPGRLRPEDEMDFEEVLINFGAKTQSFHMGMAAAAVPGQVCGMFEIHKDLCSMPMKEILAPAVQYAREGVVMNAYQAYLFTVVKDIFLAADSCRDIFGSHQQEGELVVEGEVIKQPELADFFETLAIEGPDLFYRGEVADIIERDMAQGGLINKTDLESYEVVRREPLRLSYRDVDITMNPPPCTGGILIAFGLKLLEDIDLGNIAVGSEEHLLLLADVLDKTLEARVEVEAQNCDVTKGSMVLDDAFLTRYRQDIMGRYKVSRGTTHISVMDKDKNLATMTVSNGEGNNYVVPGTGVVMNNILGEEDVNPGGFHKWTPNTRLCSMMTPATMAWPDGRRVGLGSGGSNRIRTALLQLVINLVDFGMSVEGAVSAPRIHLDGAPGQSKLDIEGGINGELERLVQAYPDHHRWDDLNMFFGGTHVVGFGEQGFAGAGDPRRSGACKIL